MLFASSALFASSESLTRSHKNSLSLPHLTSPLSLRHVLHQNKHIVFCACGLRIDTAVSDRGMVGLLLCTSFCSKMESLYITFDNSYKMAVHYTGE